MTLYLSTHTSRPLHSASGRSTGVFPSQLKFFGANPSVLRILEFGLQLPVGSIGIPLSTVLLINSHYSSQEKNAVLCQSVSDMLLKRAI